MLTNLVVFQRLLAMQVVYAFLYVNLLPLSHR